MVQSQLKSEPNYSLCLHAVLNNPVFNRWDASMVMCLGQGSDSHMAQLMPLPLTISCSGKSRLVLPFWCRLIR